MTAGSGAAPGITRLLSASVPVDAEERGHLAGMWSLARDPRCRDRDLWEPGHFTASAFVLSADGGSLALIHHGKLGRWLQPGGHVEPGDQDLLAAARREVAEETGLTDLELLGPAPFDLDVHTIPARKDDPAHQHFDVRYLFRCVGPTTLAAGEDVLGARWVPLADIGLDEPFRSDASVMRAVRKILRQQGDHRVVQEPVAGQG